VLSMLLDKIRYPFVDVLCVVAVHPVLNCIQWNNFIEIEQAPP
jgi:hypothetical protein